MSRLARDAPWACAALLAVGACARAPEPLVPVACTEIVPAEAAATSADAPLELVVVLDSVPGGPGSVRTRVDALDEPSTVQFLQPPHTAAAASMALAPPATFAGCAALAPVGLELRAPVAPRAKAWVRVSSDRPVRVRVRVPGRRTGAPLLLQPGASGIVGWEGA